MADKKLSALTDADTPLAGDELIYVVQDGNSRKVATGSLYIPGGTDVAVSDGGTGASNASDARDNLGLTIGADVQAYSATLDAIAQVSPESYGLGLLEMPDAASAQVYLDLAPVAASGDYDDLDNKPTLGTMAAEDASNYTPTSGLAAVALSNDYTDLDNLPSLAPIATSGDFDDLTNVPTNVADLADLTPGTDGQVVGWQSGELATFTASGSGDMLASMYDPNGVEADAFDSANHAYDNTGSGLSATNVQDAIDKIASTAVQSVVAGANITVDATDPRNPIISASAASGRLDIADFSQLATDFVYDSPDPGQQQVAAGDVILWREKGIAWKVASSTATDAHLDYTGNGGVLLYIMPDASGCLPFEGWGGRRAEEDPLFDNSDVFDLIHAYVHSDKGIGVERAIKFPIGRFNHSRTLKIDWRHATFIGSGSLAAVRAPTPEHPIRSDGTFICYTGNDGGVGVDVGTGGSGYIYHVTVENIRFGTSSPSMANCTVMRWKGLSEFYFRNIGLQGGKVLLEMDDVGIGHLSSFYMADSSEAHMLFNGETGAVNNIWFENGNLWLAKNSTFKFIAGIVQNVSFTDSWVELAEHIFEFAPDVDAFTSFSLFHFVRTRFQNGSDFEDDWPTQGREGWFIKAVPSQNYTNRSLLIDGWVFEDCYINISSDSSPGAAVVYDRGDNIGAQSLIQNMTFRGGYFTGTLGAYTIFKGPGSVFCYGTRKDSGIQWTDGSTRVVRLGQEFHYWEFDGRPVRLPVIQTPSITTAGQIYWHQGTQLPRVVDRDGFARTVLHSMPVTTASRPALSGSAGPGVMVFDTDLGKPIWWDGSKWVDATGAEADEGEGEGEGE